MWYLSEKCLEIFSNSMLSPTVSNLLFLFVFTVQGFLISVTVFLLLDFSPQIFILVSAFL